MSKKNNKIPVAWQIKAMEYLSYLMVFLVPLYISKNHYFSFFSFPKTIIIISLTLIMTFLYVWSTFKNKNLKIRITPLHIALFIFLFAITLSSLFGVDVYNSFFGSFTQSIHLVLLYILTIFSLILDLLIRNNNKFLPRFLLVSFISSILVSITLFGNFSTSLLNMPNDREGGVIGNSSYAGGYFLFNIFFAIGLVLYYKESWKKILIFLGLILIFLSPVFFNADILNREVSLVEAFHNPLLFMGTANAAILGIVISLLFIGALLLTWFSKRIYKIIGLFLVITVLVGSILVGNSLTNSSSWLHQKYTEVKKENRLIAWEIANRGFLDAPILGIGFNNFSYTFQKYFNPDILNDEKHTEVYFNQPHNVYLEYLSNNGILGLVSYLGLLVLIFISLFYKNEKDVVDRKRPNKLKIILASILFGYFVQNLFGFDTPITYLMMFSLIGIAMGLNYKYWSFEIPEKFNYLIRAIKILVLILCLTSMILFVVLPWKESKKWNKIATSKNINEVLILRKEKIQDISFFGSSYDSGRLANNYFKVYQNNINMINNENRKYYLEDINLLIEQTEKELQSNPNDIFSHIVASQLLDLYMIIDNKKNDDLWNRSMDHLNQAIRINPKNSEIYLILARTHLINNDFQGAKENIKKAIITAPKYYYPYQIAREVLKIRKDDELEKFVNLMEKRYINQINK